MCFPKYQPGSFSGNLKSLRRDGTRALRQTGAALFFSHGELWASSEQVFKGSYGIYAVALSHTHNVKGIPRWWL